MMIVKYDVVKYKVSEGVPNQCVPGYLTKGKIYRGIPLPLRHLIKILEDDEGDELLIATKSSRQFYPYKGNPLEEVN